MCKTSPGTCHRSSVLKQLETWAQFPQCAQLLFVEQLALELSEQLDVAGDASSRCRAISDRNAHPEPSAFPYDALVYIAAENGEHCSQSLRCDLTLPMVELKRKSLGSASTRTGSSEDDLEEQCSESADRNQQPSLPHAALVGIATENGEHCSQSFRCDLTLPMWDQPATETTCILTAVQVFGPFELPEEVLLNLLPYLSVDDLMEWRVTSCQTRSPR
ncbi:unnamed protein product, partial [Symbiodinium necroappetens]